MRMKKRLLGLSSSGILVLLLSFSVQSSKRPTTEESDRQTLRQTREVDYAAVPYAFTSEDWGTAVGASGVMTGLFQPQLSMFASVAASNNGSWLGFVGLNNLMIPRLGQWLFDLQLLDSYYNETNYFIDGNPDFEHEQAGSNHSSGDNFIRTSGKESHYFARLRYILPIGDGTHGAIASMLHRKGEVSQASGKMNPFSNGFTTFEVQPFYKQQDLGDRILQDGSTFEKEDTEVQGIRFILDYDNRDSTQEPTKGNHLEFRYTWGNNLPSRVDWSTWELGISQFFDLGVNNLMREQVIALNAWWADTPSWNQTQHANGRDDYRRPPSFSGVSLGGSSRLRGYSTHRFHGRSAVSYSAEYRVKPQWQPLQRLPVLGDIYDLPWWQWTLFADLGRVADTFSARDLHTDMKYSLGAGVRFKAEGVTARADFAISEEGHRLVFFVNQPF